MTADKATVARDEDEVTSGEITRLLQRAADGDRGGLDELYRVTYRELRRIARGQRGRHARPAAELNTTALVHEAFLKFERSKAAEFADREHFFAVAASAMRQLLVDEARRTLRDKRGAGAVHLSMDDVLGGAASSPLMEQSERVIDLDDALNELGEQDQRLLRTVECKVFAGMEESEIARVFSVSVRTVRRDWAKARAWMGLRLS